MRGVILLVLTLVLPTISATIPLESDECSIPPYDEVILELESGIWTQDLWDGIKLHGYYPLRSISSSQILAMQVTWNNPPAGIIIDSRPNAEYLFSLDQSLPSSGQEVRLVFEPRIPAFVADYLEEKIIKMGYDLDLEADYPLHQPHTITYSSTTDLQALLELPGMLWIEPVLETSARYDVAANLLSNGDLNSNPAWKLGLNGQGVVIGYADSGIDYDHDCFRNSSTIEQGENASIAIGNFSSQHRKIVAANFTIDEGDNMGHSDFRHGTHVAGSLVCHLVDDDANSTMPQYGTAFSYASKLVAQDVVSQDGWIVPDVEFLLFEAAMNGAVIHSDSWGDDTTAYTARSGDFDAWSLEHPWSLQFIAPGNNGKQLMEPANARNVLAIGASQKSDESSRWTASSHGPTQAGSDGIFALATGVGIYSANGDGDLTSLNGGMRISTGTSMATPTAASFAAIVQQMVEQGWIVSDNETLTPVSLLQIRPQWHQDNNSSSLELGPGFTPSGPLMHALLALATDRVEANPDEGGGDLSPRNEFDGWGVFNLSQLVDFENLEANIDLNGQVKVADNLWIHDSYRLNSTTPLDLLLSRDSTGSPLDDLLAAPWNGSDAVGPFLTTGESWAKRLTPIAGEDLSLRFSIPAAPEPDMVEDFQVMVHLSNGKVVLADSFDATGYSTQYYGSSFDITNTSNFPASNETTKGIEIAAEDLEEVEWMEIEVLARYVTPGNSAGTVGLDGDRLGFALAVKGVIRDDPAFDDDDGDGVVNSLDLCPQVNANGWDENKDGCIDDTDGDGILDPVDNCILQNSTGFDNDQDGCIDDSDQDGILDDIDECFTQVLSPEWPVMENGCRPQDQLAQVEIISLPDNGTRWEDVFSITWAVDDADDDIFTTGANLMLIDENVTGGEYRMVGCSHEYQSNGQFECMWFVPNDLPLWDIRGQKFHVEIFVKSHNMSPEANMDFLIFSNDSLYDSWWEENDPHNNDEYQRDKSGEVHQRRAVLWAVTGLVSGVVAALLLARRKLREYADLDNPFVGHDTRALNSGESE